MTIARQEEFVRDEILPSWFVNRLQDRVAALSSFRLDLLNATTVRAVGGTGEDAAVLNIGGNWRFNEAAVTRAHPGGAAGTYLVFVTAKAQDVRNVPAPGSDFTNYAFALAIVANGATPPIVAGTVDIYRRVGSLLWNGTAITGLVQETAGVIARPQIEVALTRPVFTALPTPLFDGQEILYQTAAMLTAGVGPWALRYNSSLAGTSKWKVLAADRWHESFTGSVSVPTTGGWIDFADVGPTIALPVVGDYLIEFGAELAAGSGSSIGVSPVATGLVGAFARGVTNWGTAVPAAVSTGGLSRQVKATAISGTLKMQVQAAANNPCFASQRWISVAPIRLG